MAKNKVQDGKLLYLAVLAGVLSGHPVVVGNGIPGVAQIDRDANGKSVIDTDGVYDLSVKGENDAGNVAVAVGDRLYWDGTTTLSKKVSGKFFGCAVEIVGSGLTDTINVKIGGTGVAPAPYSIFAAGIYEFPASPAPDSTTEISVPGILATDMCIVQQAVDSAVSPSNQILTAIPQVSPAAILVTTAGAPTAGDKMNWVVYRAAV
jgi:predicted RecA/RadA family phage recombinase